MKYLIALIAALFLIACAGHGDYVQNEQPAYWMKQYASADQAKINRCMDSANVEYDKYVSLQWAPNLMKANEWESCMDGK